MRNSDGGTYHLTWERTPEGLRAWVVSHPHLSVTAPTVGDLVDLMNELIDEKLHAGEWSADWAPPLPQDSDECGRLLDSHVCLSGDGRFFCLQDPREIYETTCDNCGHPTGPRTNAPSGLTSRPPKTSAWPRPGIRASRAASCCTRSGSPKRSDR